MNVYVIQAGNKKGAIKIGVADNPSKRLDDLQVGNHVELKILAVIPCSSKTHAYHLEGVLHRELSKYKIRGEWFQNKVNLKIIFDSVHKKGLKAELVPECTTNQNLIKKIRKRNLKNSEIKELYDVLKDKIKASEFAPIDEILDEQIIQ
jgi:hypothetical protein